MRALRSPIFAIAAATLLGLATPIAVGLVLVHNFTWHRHWTWPTRYELAGARMAGFVRFAVANGLVSLIGNSALVPLFVSVLGWRLMAATLASIGLCGLFNFWIAAQVVFGPPHRRRDPSPVA